MIEEKLTFVPLTSARWNDFETLFGPRGACGGCWCMYWRLPSRVFSESSGDANRFAMKQLVLDGAEPGILAYDGDKAVGWCAVAPRVEYTRLERSRVLKAVDDQPVWAISCFFVARSYRRQGLTFKLLEAAVAFAAEHGAEIVEGYPILYESDKVPAVWAYTGFESTFLAAGFVEVARRSPRRPILRRVIKKGL
jgi:GNAT superfamily N-acetyltransferase